MAESDPQEIIEGEVLDALEMQKHLDQMESELMQIDKFKEFIEFRNALNDKMASVRKQLEVVLVPLYQEGKIDKSVKGEGFSVTITESDKFEIDEAVLPKKFWKTVPDTTKIRKSFQLEGQEPKGCKQFKSYGILLKLKGKAE